jgi:hypothetical protein
MVSRLLCVCMDGCLASVLKLPLVKSCDGQLLI